MNNNPSNSINFSESLSLGLKGFCMGVADIIPGISGGTIAFILGIYEDLIYAIRSFDEQFLKRIFKLKFREAFDNTSWKFIVCVFGGIALAISVLSGIISHLLENYPVLVHAFFFGLILATVPIIALIIRRWTYLKILAVIVSSIFTYFLVAMTPMQTPEVWWFIFLSGAVSICAMILPGISGAFILVLLGKYQFLLNAVNERDLVNIAIFIAGICVGIISFVRVLSWLLHKYHDVTIAVLTGFVIGSLNKIWPWKETIEVIYGGHGKIIPTEQINIVPVAFNSEVLSALLLMGAGFVLALILNYSHKKETLRF